MYNEVMELFSYIYSSHGGVWESLARELRVETGYLGSGTAIPDGFLEKEYGKSLMVFVDLVGDIPKLGPRIYLVGLAAQANPEWLGMGIRHGLHHLYVAPEGNLPALLKDAELFFS